MHQGEKVGLGLAIFGLAVFTLGLHIGDLGVVLWGLMLAVVGVMIFCAEGGSDHDLSV